MSKRAAEIRELVALARELGVTRLKHGEIEIALGPVPLPPLPREKPAEIRKPLKHPTQTSPNGTPRSDDVLFRAGVRENG